MKNLLILLIAAVVFTIEIPAGAQAPKKAAPVVTANDKTLSARLVGKWQVRYEDKERKRKSIAWTVYAANGMASSRSITKGGEREINLVLEAKWSINNGVLTTTVTKSSDTKIVKVGSRTRDKILSLNEKQFKYIDEDAKTVTETRVPNDPPRR